jgi:hypothetical protein
MLLARLAKEAGLPDGVLQVAFVCMCVCVGKVQSVCVCVVCDEQMRAES